MFWVEKYANSLENVSISTEKFIRWAHDVGAYGLKNIVFPYQMLWQVTLENEHLQQGKLI